MPTVRRFRRHHAGFSLVEIMVGMVIGMFGIIIMMQVFALAEERKRTTTSGGDSMSEGVMAMYALQRDIQQAGYGFASPTTLTSPTMMFGCTVTLSGVNIPLAPVTINPATTIVPAGDANTDTLLVFYGNPEGQPQGSTYTAGTVSLAASNYYVVNSPCNPSPISTGVTSVATSGTIYDLGTAPKVLAYAIRSGNLTVCDYVTNNCSLAANTGNPSIWVPIANNIVSLRAQYGRDTLTVTPNPVPDPPQPYVVDAYDQTTPSAATVPSAACGWAKIGAVRLALVARSAQFEKTAVTAAAPTWEGTTVNVATTPTNPTAVAINLAANPDGSANANWQNYRYKLFQTVIPLRNVAWLGMQTGC